MNEAHAQTFTISLADSLAFAGLSGDFNPLHVDPVAARRTQFGSTVVHGIHAALKALDVLLDHWPSAGLQPSALSANFQNPVRTGASVHVALSTDGNRFRIVAESAGRPAFTLNVKLDTARANASQPVLPDVLLPRTEPAHLPFPPAVSAGSVPLALASAVYATLFPSLHAAAGTTAWVADLVGTTRIVGMECPGLDSIYSGFKLTRLDDAPPPMDGLMSFVVKKVDPRFRLAKLAVRGNCLEGVLDTFFRPPAVAQISLQEVMQRVEPDRYGAQKALVVGGSRGLGEIAAKVLLAGGAHVTISYVRGVADARRLQAEAHAVGMVCAIAELDVSRPLPDAVLQRLRAAGYTHVYFFASPHIEKNSSGHWDHALFERFCNVYVRGYVEVVESVAGDARSAPRPRVLYPSSAFLDTVEPGFAEYCSAKAAGEMASRHMTTTLNVAIACPRLPRMRTDQTSALMESGVDDPYPVISRLVSELSS